MQRECDKERKKEYKSYDWYQKETLEALERYDEEGKSEGRKYKNMKELAEAISRYQGQTVSQERVSYRLKQMKSATRRSVANSEANDTKDSEYQVDEHEPSSPACSLHLSTIQRTEDEETWVEDYTHNRISR